MEMPRRARMRDNGYGSFPANSPCKAGWVDQALSMSNPCLAQSDIDSFQRDGVVLIKGLFAEHVDTIRAGIERNMAEPGPYAAENLKSGDSGRFFDDYCNWTRILEF